MPRHRDLPAHRWRAARWPARGPVVTRVVIADDHLPVRQAIAALLGDIAGVEVVGQGADGQEAVDLATQWRPDIVLLDVDMPGMSGLEALVRINETLPDVHVVMLSMHDSEELALTALKLGAAGFMLKDAAPEELAPAIKAVGRGRTWLSAAVSKAAIPGTLERSGRHAEPSLPTADAACCHIKPGHRLL